MRGCVCECVGRVLFVVSGVEKAELILHRGQQRMLDQGWKWVPSFQFRPVIPSLVSENQPSSSHRHSLSSDALFCPNSHRRRDWQGAVVPLRVLAAVLAAARLYFA